MVRYGTGCTANGPARGEEYEFPPLGTYTFPFGLIRCTRIKDSWDEIFSQTRNRMEDGGVLQGYVVVVFLGVMPFGRSLQGGRR